MTTMQRSGRRPITSLRMTNGLGTGLNVRRNPSGSKLEVMETNGDIGICIYNSKHTIVDSNIQKYRHSNIGAVGMWPQTSYAWNKGTPSPSTSSHRSTTNWSTTSFNLQVNWPHIYSSHLISALLPIGIIMVISLPV